MTAETNQEAIRVFTGTRYRVDVDGDGTLRVEFTATLEAVEFEANGNFAALIFDNGVRLWPWDAQGGFVMEAVKAR
jgi:hypothetical protein